MIQIINLIIYDTIMLIKLAALLTECSTKFITSSFNQ